MAIQNPSRHQTMHTNRPKHNRLDPNTIESLRIDQAAVFYFIAVFAAGCVFGVLRALFVEPQVGARNAELLEWPLMIGVVSCAARWIVGKVSLKATIEWLIVGAVALAMLVFCEAVMIKAVRGIDIGTYLENRDLVAFVAYVLALAWFAVAPFVIAFVQLRRNRFHSINRE